MNKRNIFKRLLFGIVEIMLPLKARASQPNLSAPKTFQNDPIEPFCVVCGRLVEVVSRSDGITLGFTRITMDNRQEWIHGGCLALARTFGRVVPRTQLLVGTPDPDPLRFSFNGSSFNAITQ